MSYDAAEITDANECPRCAGWGKLEETDTKGVFICRPKHGVPTCGRRFERRKTLAVHTLVELD